MSIVWDVVTYLSLSLSFSLSLSLTHAFMHAHTHTHIHTQGEVGLGEKGFKELVKGMSKSSGALQVEIIV